MTRIVWLLICVLLAPSAMATEYELYILSGQSNMDGRGKVADLPVEMKKPLDNVPLYYFNSAHGNANKKGLGEWVSFAPGYSVAPGYKGELPSPTFGPEIAFTHSLLKSRAGKNIAILKISRGGTSLSKDWAPGANKNDAKAHGPCYKDFLKHTAAAFAALKAKGDTFTIKGMAWHQGESDAKLTEAEYTKLLTEFIGRVREDFAIPDLKFVIGEVYDNKARDTVRAAQLAVSKSVKNTAFVSQTGTETFDKGTHFDAKSQLLLGERFAVEIVK